MNRSGSSPQSRLMTTTAVVVMLVAGLLTLGTTVAGPPPAAAASSVGGPITRAEVIARAKYWYDRGDTWYSQDQADAISDGTGGEYRPDCSGLVAMAWHLPKKPGGWDLNTGDFHTYDDRTWLDSLHDLLPGDALLREGHMELFEKWVDQNDHSKGAWVYSENDYGEKTNHNTNDWEEMKTFRGIRYDKILDGAVDFSGDGNADVMARHGSDYDLYMFKGNGSGRFADGPPVRVGNNWSAYNVIFSPGDFNGDGNVDVLARHASTADLYLFRGTGSGRFIDDPPVRVGNNWSAYNAIFSPGDFNGDGHADVLARHESNYDLYMFKGNGSGRFIDDPPVRVGNNWSAYNAIF